MDNPFPTTELIFPKCFSVVFWLSQDELNFTPYLYLLFPQPLREDFVFTFYKGRNAYTNFVFVLKEICC